MFTSLYVATKTSCTVKDCLSSISLALHISVEVLPPSHRHLPFMILKAANSTRIAPLSALELHPQNVETLHGFACHPFAGAMLIFSVSIPIFHMYCLSKYNSPQALLPFFYPVGTMTPWMRCSLAVGSILKHDKSEGWGLYVAEVNVFSIAMSCLLFLSACL